MEETEKEKRKMSRLSLIVDAWIREVEEASQWVENLEGRINNHNLEQFSTVESARSRLSELGVKLDRLESLLRNPPAKPILTEEDLNFRWKMLSDIQLRTRALARCLYALPSPNRPGNVPATDTKKCSISASCLDQDMMKTSDSQDEPELLKPLVQSDDASGSQGQIQTFSSFITMASLWKACSTIFLLSGLAALLFILILLCTAIYWHVN